jgi:hypothetical protein
VYVCAYLKMGISGMAALELPDDVVEELIVAIMKDYQEVLKRKNEFN